jgi:hypothetical protein
LKYKANNILSKSVFKDRKKIIGQFEIYCTLIWPRLKDEKEKNSAVENVDLFILPRTYSEISSMKTEK